MLNYDVLYSYYGSRARPQPGIVGVRLRYELGTVEYKCRSDYCGPLMSFEIRSIVNFVFVSNAIAKLYFPPPPSLGLALPNDIFYPFVVSGSSGLSPNFYLILILIIFIQ